MTLITRALTGTIAWIGLVGVVGADTGQFTTIDHQRKSELDIPGIFASFYRGEFTSVGNDYTNGVYTMTRVDDGTSGSLGPSSVDNLSTSERSDQLWTVKPGEVVNVTVYSAFSNGTQEFGFLPGAKGSIFHKLVTPSGEGLDARGAATGIDLYALTGGTFRFARANRSGGKPVFSSQMSDNGDRKDHMVTYKVTGGDGPAHWLLFFENSSDFDFNDLTVEVNVGSAYVPPNYNAPVQH